MKNGDGEPGFALSLSGICKSFGDSRVLSDLSFTVSSGSVVGLIGPSGGGKSVLLKIIAGVLREDGGRVSNGNCSVSLMFQEGALFDFLSVFDNVAFPIVRGRVPVYLLPRSKQREIYERVGRSLAQVGLSDAAQKVPAQLSGGMRRRVSMARALVSDPSLLLLDDPTSGLDPVASAVIMELIMELHGKGGTTMIVVSHDLRRLLPRVDQVLALFHGEIVYQGPVEQVLEKRDAALQRFISSRYDLEGAQGPYLEELAVK